MPLFSLSLSTVPSLVCCWTLLMSSMTVWQLGTCVVLCLLHIFVSMNLKRRKNNHTFSIIGLFCILYFYNLFVFL
ncbi:hypothetical protein MtrunA17_Chr3g0081581 [Medicago truncatula]|uniref:Transmembrane protein n=1 Tax=Medicago truncatula TaxID=3880 RepID=A0A396INY0_MEDTR|nr:hypothetical protein MtrunA17_Chr3g0081581 [Medicago truncatula]